MKKSPRNKNEVLRYLGYRNQNLDKVTNDLIEESMEEMRNLIKKKHIHRSFNIVKGEKELYLKDTNLTLIGKDIKKHLDKSETCILMAVTLGNEVDSKIRYYEKISMTKALILDACATTAIEEISDEICEELEETANKENKTLTSRYSPGYGDLPIDIQKDFLSVLGAQKAIGLTATAHSILIPRKSVTAIVGLMDIKHKQNPNEDLSSPKNNSCLTCKNYATCIYSREGGKCGGYIQA